MKVLKKTEPVVAYEFDCPNCGSTLEGIAGEDIKEKKIDCPGDWLEFIVPCPVCGCRDRRITDGIVLKHVFNYHPEKEPM